MKQRAYSIIKHPLFSGSAIMVVGSNLNNVLNYFYHFIFGRILGPSQYGELVSLISLLGLLSASFSFFGLVIVKFAATSKKSELPKLFKWFDNITTKIAVGLGIIVLLFNRYLAGFLHIDTRLIMLVSVLILVNVKLFTARSFLSGLLKFKQIVMGTNIDILLRITAGSLFIYLGFSVFGAVMGLLVASAIAAKLYYRFLNIDTKISGKFEFEKSKEIVRYTLPVFFLSLATMSFFSSDVILVKHYFDSHDAGIYGALANMGKIIFYALSPVSAVMFPMVSKKHSKGESSKKLLLFSVSLVLSGVVAVLFVYKFFPGLAISILFGSKFLEASEFLFIYGLAMALFSVSSLMVNYYLSIEKYLPVALLSVASVIQIAGITIYHSGLGSIVSVSLFSVAFLATSLLLYSVNDKTRGQKGFGNNTSL